MPDPPLLVRRGRLADGREIIYYDERVVPTPPPIDRRPLSSDAPRPQVRFDPLAGEWVAVASFRQERTHLPPAGACPLCPSAPGRLTEVPAADYDVVVFENRFPSFAGAGYPLPEEAERWGRPEPAPGRCEVVCFSSDHRQSLGWLGRRRLRTVVDMWAHRTEELSRRPEVEQVLCFENRGEEIGVTLSHPHGQIYAYPFVAPRTRVQMGRASRHHQRTGTCLFCDLVRHETGDGTRIVARAPGWVAFVPFAARWPYEVHVYPTRHVGDLCRLDAGERDSLAELLSRVLPSLDGLFARPMPYVLAWQQSPVRAAPEAFHLHAEISSPRRSADRLKYLAGSETAGGVFINDVLPEEGAARLRTATPR